MTMPEFIDKSYQPPEKEYKKFPPGDYMVNGMDWISNDANKNPILKPNKNGQLQAMLKFRLEGSTKETVIEGPPFSLDIYKMNLLFRAFGMTDFPEVPEETHAGMVAAFMTTIKNRINDSGQLVRVTVVNDPWVSYVDGMRVEGNENYFMQFIGLISKDESGTPSWFTVTFPSGGSANLV